MCGGDCLYNAYCTHPLSTHVFSPYTHTPSQHTHRTSSSLVESLTPAEYVATVFLSIPVWIMVFVIRFVLLILFKPLYWLAKSDLNMREIAFITFSGLRGCVTLIMAQAVVTETTSSGEARVRVGRRRIVMIFHKEEGGG